MTGQSDQRCPACGALVAPAAEWCTQCYQPLGRGAHTERGGAGRAPGPQVSCPSDRPSARPQPVARTVEVVWDQPTNGNGVEAAGASPAVVLPQAPPPPVAVERGPEPPGSTTPAKRLVWHCPLCGSENAMELDLCPTCATPFTRLFEEPVERPDVDPRNAAKWSLVFPGLGHARIGRSAEGVARGVLFLWSFGTALLVLLSHPSGLGVIKGLAVLFLLAAVLAYALAAVDAFRQAAGDGPVLSPRALLYGTAGLVIMSVGSLFVVVIRATHPH